MQSINTHNHGSSPIHLRPKCLFQDINDFEEIVDLPYSNIEKTRVLSAIISILPNPWSRRQLKQLTTISPDKMGNDEYQGRLRKSSVRYRRPCTQRNNTIQTTRYPTSRNIRPVALDTIMEFHGAHFLDHLQISLFKDFLPQLMVCYSKFQFAWRVLRQSSSSWYLLKKVSEIPSLFSQFPTFSVQNPRLKRSICARYFEFYSKQL